MRKQGEVEVRAAGVLRVVIGARSRKAHSKRGDGCAAQSPDTTKPAALPHRAHFRTPSSLSNCAARFECAQGNLERAKGVEPSSSAWEAEVIAVIRRPLEREDQF